MIKPGRPSGASIGSCVTCSMCVWQMGFSALHCAAIGRHAADKNEVDRRRTGQLKVLKALKTLGADFAQVELGGFSAFDLAALHGQHHLVAPKQAELWQTASFPPRRELHHVSARELPFKPKPGRVHWSDVNQKRLRTAARAGDLQSVQALLSAGADPDARDEHGRTAADRALERGHKHIVEELRNADREPFVEVDDAPRLSAHVPKLPLSNATDDPGSTPGRGRSAETARLLRQADDDDADDEDDGSKSVKRKKKKADAPSSADVPIEPEGRVMYGRKRVPDAAPSGAKGMRSRNWSKPRSLMAGLSKLGRGTGPIPPAELRLVRLFNEHALAPQADENDEGDALLPSDNLPMALAAAQARPSPERFDCHQRSL
jgi:hypothetical protein